MPSQHINKFEYNEQARELRVTFHNGSEYRYSNVPPSIATGMGKAKSVGAYFHVYVKSRPNIYKATKVEKK